MIFRIIIAGLATWRRLPSFLSTRLQKAVTVSLWSLTPRNRDMHALGTAMWSGGRDEGNERRRLPLPPGDPVRQASGGDLAVRIRHGSALGVQRFRALPIRGTGRRTGP